MSIQKFAIFLLCLIFQAQALAADLNSANSTGFLRKEPAEKVIWYGGLVAKMITFYGQSCANGEGEGCFNLAMIYDTGDASVQNKTQANVYYKQSCELDFALACNNLGISSH
jgi:TPR repeat protein